jgi:hypothetical protein
MDNKIINKFLKFIKVDVTPAIKKDFKWSRRAIINDLKKLTKKKSTSKKNDNRI